MTQKQFIYYLEISKCRKSELCHRHSTMTPSIVERGQKERQSRSAQVKKATIKSTWSPGGYLLHPPNDTSPPESNWFLKFLNKATERKSEFLWHFPRQYESPVASQSHLYHHLSPQKSKWALNSMLMLLLIVAVSVPFTPSICLTIKSLSSSSL